MTSRASVLLVALAACGGSRATPTTTAAPTPIAALVDPDPISDPAEYAIPRISREAGEAIFTRTGIGDPYRTGVPYPMFLALLRAFPTTFGATPDALAGKFGFIARAADPRSPDPDVRAGLPVGLHLTIDPLTAIPFVVTSCALCHAETIRWPGGSAFVVGLANKRVRIHAYDAAFAAITTQRGFSADHLGRLAREAATAAHVPWPDAYAPRIVATVIAALQRRAADRAALHARVADGLPGRVATIEAFALVLGQLTGAAIAPAPTVGWAKVPDVIGFPVRTTLAWDGSGQGSMDLLAVEADVAAGVRVAWLERHPFQGASLGAYLRQPAPRPSFPGTIDRALAARGQALFAAHCEACHGRYAADGRVVDYDEPIVALADVGTDPARADAATASFTRAANDPHLTRGYTRFAPTGGYVPPVLTNVWARAPYGHVGQWPSLAVLATPPAGRPSKLVIASGADYDLDAVGVATHPVGALADGEYVYDATRPGLSNAGHPFLAELGGDARAVVEYLKTL